MTRTIARGLPAVAWMALIFWFSSQSELPRPASDLLNLLMRKSAHFGVYAVLALCYHWALGGETPIPPAGSSRRRIMALLLAVLYAISDEYHQSWTPLRQPSLIDVAIDTAGAATALWVLPWLWRRATNRPAQPATEHSPSQTETHP